MYKNRAVRYAALKGDSRQQFRAIHAALEVITTYKQDKRVP